MTTFTIVKPFNHTEACVSVGQVATQMRREALVSTDST